MSRGADPRFSAPRGSRPGGAPHSGSASGRAGLRAEVLILDGIHGEAGGIARSYRQGPGFAVAPSLRRTRAHGDRATESGLLS